MPVLDKVSTYNPVVAPPGGKFGPSGGSVPGQDPRNQWPGGAYGTGNNPRERDPSSSLDETLGRRRDFEARGPSEAPPTMIGAPFGYNDVTDVFGFAVENIGKALMPPVVNLAVEAMQSIAAPTEMGFSSSFSVPEAATVATPLGRRQMKSKHVMHNLMSKGLDVTTENAMTEIANIVAAQHSGINDPTPGRSRTDPVNKIAAEMMMADRSNPVAPSGTNPSDAAAAATAAASNATSVTAAVAAMGEAVAAANAAAQGSGAPGPGSSSAGAGAGAPAGHGPGQGTAGATGTGGVGAGAW